MNPFIQNFKLNVIRVTETKFRMDTDKIPKDGIIVGNYEEYKKSYLAEQQKKTTVYDVPFIENVLFNEIKSNGRDLLLYIIYNLQTNSDTIVLNTEKVCKKMSTSRATLYKAIIQLTDIAVICKKHKDEYWINPFYLFKGSRIDYYNSVCPDCIEVVANIKA